MWRDKNKCHVLLLKLQTLIIDKGMYVGMEKFANESRILYALGFYLRKIKYLYLP